MVLWASMYSSRLLQGSPGFPVTFELGVESGTCLEITLIVHCHSIVAGIGGEIAQVVVLSNVFNTTPLDLYKHSAYV